MLSSRFSVSVILSVVFLLVVGTPQCVWAQFNPFSGGSSSSSGTLSGGSRSTSSSPVSGAASAADVSSQFRSLNSSAGAGSGNANSGFVGQGNNAGRFVGSQQSSQARNSRASSQSRNFNRSTSSARNFNQASRRNTTNRSTFNQFGSSTSKTGSFRPVMQLAFAFPTRASSEIDRSLQARFTDLPRRSARAAGLEGVVLQVGKAGEVTLSGEVETERAKRLAATLARFEPGVRAVKNELTVAAPPAKP